MEIQKLYDFDEIEFELELLDDTTADLTFYIPFQEPITAVKNKKGNLIIDGENFELKELEIKTAKEIDIMVDKHG